MGPVLSNRGMFGDFSPSQAKTIRMLAAVIFIWTWTLYDGKTGVTLTAFRENPQVIDWLARSRCFCRSGSGRLCLTVGSAARRNWRSEHLHAMDKKPYAFLLMFPRNLALAHRQQESSMLSAQGQLHRQQRLQKPRGHSPARLTLLLISE